MKTNLILLLLIISIGLNIYSYTIIKSNNYIIRDVDKRLNTRTDVRTGEEWTFCNNETRFDVENSNKGGKEIEYDDARTKVKAYYEKHKNDNNEYKTTGFIFSKKVFDRIFSDENKGINSVRLDLIEDNKQLFLVAKGLSRKYTGLIYLEEPQKTSRIYVDQSMCPNDCDYEKDLY